MKDDRLVAVDASIAGSLDAGAEGFLSAGFNDESKDRGEEDMDVSSPEKEKRSRPRRHHHHHHRHNHGKT